jgi:hypothetical protein
MRIVFSILLLPLFSTVAYAQNEARVDFFPGFVTEADGRKKTGLIKLQDHNSSVKACIFSPGPDLPDITYPASQLIDYGIDGRKYFRVFSLVLDTLHAIQTPEPVLMECLIRGKVSLYYYKDRLFVVDAGGITELIEKERVELKDGQSFRIKDPVYRRVLKKAMSDCKGIDEYLKASRPYQKSIVKLFKDYYTCTNGGFDEFTSAADVVKLSWLVSGGLISTSLKLNSNNSPPFTYLNQAEPDNSMSFLVGVHCEASRPAFSPRFKVRIGINYIHTNEYAYTGGSVASGLSSELDINSSWIEVPVQAKYQLVRNYPVYLVLGPSASYFVNWSSHQVRTNTSTGAIYSDDGDVLRLKEFFFNLRGGFGTELLSGKMALEIQYGFAPLNFSIDAGLAPTGQLQSLNLSLGWIL